MRNDAINTSSAVSVGGGLLTIKTYTDAGTNYTGMIGTQGLFEQTSGYFEARMKFHDSPGEWSAFWLQSPTYGDPVGNPGQAGTEIDIVEHRATNSNGNTVSGRYVSAVHWDGYADDHKQVAQTHSSPGNLGNDTWHTYGLEWSPLGYKFYYDDTLQWTVSEAVSRRSEYMILSSEVRDDSWAGFVPAGGYGSFATSVTNLHVDYVRVYAGTPGDFNGNGTVDAADYVLWRRGSGSIYNQADYQVWKSHFGSLAGVGFGDAEGSRFQFAVPEPATLVLLMFAAAGWLSWAKPGHIEKYQKLINA